MQISLKWVNELLDIKTIKLNNLIEKLTLGGFEVEDILEIKTDNKKEIVLDISSTANRSDSLSIQGISKEIAALLDKPPRTSMYTLNSFNWKQIIKKSTTYIEDESYCSTFLTIIVENLTDHSSPKWIKKKLVNSGIIPVNNLLDYQNYLLLETGYPFTFYDFDKLSTKLNNSNFSLSLENAVDNQEFIAINDVKYKLNNSNLLVKANNLVISIAGIIENKEFIYSKSTKSLLIEGSIFNAAKIRQQSRILGLQTDRSARYEKSLKNTYLNESLYRLISLLRIQNPNLICKLHTVLNKSEQILEPISLRYETINKILGPIKKTNQIDGNYIPPKVISKYLKRLNFKFVYDDVKVSWKVQIPPLRSDDITREIDLIEEIGRLHGFNNFLTTLPKIQTIGNKDLSYRTREKITSCLVNLGLNELIHYSLVNETPNNKIKLINPLLSDCSNLRASLLPNLITTVQDNLKQSNLLIEGFEYGHIFCSDNQTRFKEKESVAGIFGGTKTKLTWSETASPLTWFEAKGKIEQLFNQLNFVTYWKPRSSSIKDKIFHPYRNGEVYLINGKKIGNFGQIHPILANQLTISPNIYLFEFDIQTIQEQIQKNDLTSYKEYSSYPKIIKDLSFIIRQDITFSELQEVLYLNGTQFLSEINLLDEYRGQSIPDKHISLCLQLVFQSTEKTLKNKDIENIIKNLQLILTNKFSAILRN